MVALRQGDVRIASGQPLAVARIRLERQQEARPSIEAALVADEVEIAVQVNGKLRGTFSIAKDADRDALLAAARAVPNVERHLVGMATVKEIVVPGKLVNLVVKPA